MKATLEKRLRLAEDAIERLEDDIFNLRDTMIQNTKSSIELADALSRLAMLVDLHRCDLESLQKLVEERYGRE